MLTEFLASVQSSVHLLCSRVTTNFINQISVIKDTIHYTYNVLLLHLTYYFVLL